jgi:hypothetical protein
MPDDWVPFPGNEGKNFNLSQCGLVRDYWQSKYRCNTKDVIFRKCFWSESSSTSLTVNNISVDLSTVTLSVSPYRQTPFGFWHNESHYIIDWKENNSFKDTRLNYNCKPINKPSEGGIPFVLPTPVPLNMVSELVSCVVQVEIPEELVTEKFKFCGLINTVHNPDSGVMGLGSTRDRCMVRLGNDMSESFYVTLSQNELKFLKGWTSLGCIDKGSGLYGDCSNELPLIKVNSKIQGLDLEKEVVIDQRNVLMNSDKFTNGWLNPFQVLLAQNIEKTFFWVLCASTFILAICAIVLGVYCYCKKKKSGKKPAVLKAPAPQSA